MSNSPASSAPQVSPHQGSFATSRVRPETYRWVVLGAAVTAQATASVAILGVTALIPFLQQAFDLSLASATLAVSAVNIGPILSMLFMGQAIDRYGERTVVAFTMLAMGATAIVAATVDPSYMLLLLILGVVGAMYGAVQPGGTRAIVRWFPANRRGLAMGLRQAGLPLGGGLAAATLPLLAINYGWSAALWAQGCVAITGGLIFGLIYRDKNQQPADAAPAAAPSIAALLRLLVKQTNLRPVVIAGAAMVSLQYTVSAHIVLFSINQLHVPLLEAEFLLAVMQLVGVPGRIFLTWLTDHIWPGNRLRSLKWTMLASGVGLVAFSLLPAQPPSWVLLALCVWIGFFGIGWYTLFLIQVAELAPQSAVASTISFALTLNQIAIVLAPPALGLLVGVTGSYQLGWMVLAAVVLVATIFLRVKADPEARALN